MIPPWVADLVLYIAAFVLTVVIAYYHFTATWWKTPEGRHVMAWTFCTWAILVFLTTRVGGFLPLPVVQYVRAVIYGLFVWLGAWRFVLIAKAQHRKPEPGVPPSEVPPFKI